MKVYLAIFPPKSILQEEASLMECYSLLMKEEQFTAGLLKCGKCSTEGLDQTRTLKVIYIYILFLFFFLLDLFHWSLLRRYNWFNKYNIVFWW